MQQAIKIGISFVRWYLIINALAFAVSFVSFGFDPISAHIIITINFVQWFLLPALNFCQVGEIGGCYHIAGILPNIIYYSSGVIFYFIIGSIIGYLHKIGENKLNASIGTFVVIIIAFLVPIFFTFKTMNTLKSLIVTTEESCSRLSNQNHKNVCYFGLSKGITNNAYICDQITDEYMRSRCETFWEYKAYNQKLMDEQGIKMEDFFRE